MLSERSCRGFVRHVRRTPRHAFRYPVWMVYLDVDVGPDLDPGAVRRFGMDATRRRLLSPEAVRHRLRERGIGEEVRVFALTQPRSLAGSFNPVSFYFCWSRRGLAAAVLEVTNTPWRERHSYVLEPDACPNGYRFAFGKELHVSPFLPMDGRYAMRVVFGRDTLRLAMRFDPAGGGSPAMAAGLGLRLAPLTPREALLGALRQPLQNGTTLARIYREALRLRTLGAAFHPHPDAARDLSAHEPAPGRSAPASTRPPPGAGA